MMPFHTLFLTLFYLVSIAPRAIGGASVFFGNGCKYWVKSSRHGVVVLLSLTNYLTQYTYKVLIFIGLIATITSLREMPR